MKSPTCNRVYGIFESEWLEFLVRGGDLASKELISLLTSGLAMNRRENCCRVIRTKQGGVWATPLFRDSG